MPISDHIKRTLVRLSDHVQPPYFERTKLALRAYGDNGIPYGDLEDATTISELHKKIERYSETFVGHDATALLQFMLLMVGAANADKINKLGSNERSLEVCQRGSKFSKLVCRLCAGLSGDEYSELKGLACDRLDVGEGLIKSREDFFQKCISQGLLQRDDGEFAKFKEWLDTLKRNDLVREIDDYIRDRRENAFANDPHEESHPPLSQDLAVSNRDAPPPDNSNNEVTNRRIEERVDPDIIVQREIPADPNDTPPGEDTESKKEESTKTSNDNLVPNKREPSPVVTVSSNWSRYKLWFGSVVLCVLATVAAVIVLVVLFTNVIGYIGRVNQEPRGYELRRRDVVECGTLGWQVDNLHVREDIFATSRTNRDLSRSDPVPLQLAAINNKQLATLKRRQIHPYRGNTFSVRSESESRFTVPLDTDLPYTLSESYFNVSICLYNVDTAYLYFFDNRNAAFNFLNNHPNSTADALYPTPLGAGCQDKKFRIEKSAYYRIALDVPAGGNGTINVTVNAVHINSSSLVQADDCILDSRIPCSIGIGTSFDSHTLFCYYSGTGQGSSLLSSLPDSVHVLVEDIPRFLFHLMKIFGGVFIALFLVVVFFIALVLVLSWVICVKRHSNKKTNQCINSVQE